MESIYKWQTQLLTETSNHATTEQFSKGALDKYLTMLVRKYICFISVRLFLATTILSSTHVPDRDEHCLPLDAYTPVLFHA